MGLLPFTDTLVGALARHREFDWRVRVRGDDACHAGADMLVLIFKDASSVGTRLFDSLDDHAACWQRV